jgi:dienelactone hydrolase
LTQRIGIFGVSKGGELALFAASTYPEIRAVVGLVPSPFAWSIVPRNLNRSMPLTWQPSWTIAGRPVPYVPYEPQMSASSRDAFDISLQRHRGAIPGAMFHLENIRGPVLFVAGDDDQVWNSAEQSEIGMAYLKAHAHAYPDAYVHYPKAGHAFLFATGDRTQVRSGGTADGNAEAEKAAWIAIDDFLDRALVKPPAAS